MSSSTYAPPATTFVASPHARPLTTALTFPIRAKLLLAFGCVLLLAAITGAVGLVNLGRPRAGDLGEHRLGGGLDDCQGVRQPPARAASPRRRRWAARSCGPGP